MQSFVLSVSVRVDSRDTETIETMGELMTSMAHDLRLRASLLGLYGEYGMRLKLVHQPEVGAARPLPTETPPEPQPPSVDAN